MSVNEGDWNSAVVVVAWPVAVMAVEALVGVLMVVTGIGAIGIVIDTDNIISPHEYPIALYILRCPKFTMQNTKYTYRRRIHKTVFPDYSCQ